MSIGNDSVMNLPEDLGMFIDRLRAQFESIGEVWVMGSRVNGDGDRDVPWEFLVFADADSVTRMSRDSSWWRDGTALSAVTDGDAVRAVWGPAASGSLDDWHWRLESPRVAHYTLDGDDRKAFRIR